MASKTIKSLAVGLAVGAVSEQLRWSSRKGEGKVWRMGDAVPAPGWGDGN